MISKIIAIESEDDFDYIQLEETIFHPRGGGQPGDRGFLVKDEQKFPVVDTIKKNSTILHKVEKDHDLALLDEVELELDFQRRKILTRMHTGEHILFKSLEKNIRSLKLNKIALDPKESSILVSAPDIDIDKVLAAEKLANETIRQDKKIKEHSVLKDQLKEKFPDVRINIDRIKEPKIRVVTIDGFDTSACNGTHLETTGPVKNILITKILSQGKSFYEIRFKIDIEQDLFKLADIARHAQAQIGAPYETMLEALQNLKEDNKVLKIQINKLSKGIKVEVKKEQVGDITLLHAVFPGISKKQFIKKVNEIEKKNTVCLFLNEARNKWWVAIKVSKDLSHNANEILANLLKKVSGKGGGNKDLAQGSIQIDNPELVFKKIRSILK